MSFGEKLKERRLACRMTLESLAILVGTSRQTIQRYESGRIARPPYERIRSLATALGVTPGELLGWQSDNATANEEKSAPQDTYIVVTDDAMVYDRILEHDHVYYAPQEHIRNGALVVGKLGGTPIVRHYWQTDAGIILTAAAPDVPPIVLTPDTDWTFLGVATIMHTAL